MATRGNVSKVDTPTDTARDYEGDFISWTERQAAILNGMPKGAFGLDTDNLAEEIIDLGRSEIRETSSLLRQVLVHLIMLATQPDSEAANHWIEEILAFQGDAVLACSPGIRQRIDVPRIWSIARNASLRAQAHRGDLSDAIPEDCPLSLDELLVADFDPVAAARKIAAVTNATPGGTRQ